MKGSHQDHNQELQHSQHKNLSQRFSRPTLSCSCQSSISQPPPRNYSLGNGPLFHGQDDTVLSLHTDHGGSSTDRLHGVFDLQQVSIWTKDGNGTIVGHGDEGLICDERGVVEIIDAAANQ